MKKVLTSIAIFFGTLIIGIFIVTGIMGNYGNFAQGISMFLAAIIGLGVYLTPVIVAYKRKSSNLITVIVLNLFFGWTLFGWVISLLKALQNTQRVVLYVKPDENRKQ